MTAPSVVVGTASDAEIILPPPSAKHPLPTLTAALRLDNREQLLGLLQTNPTAPTSSISNSKTSNASSPFSQILVFGTESLRTLLLRQVLTDPHQRTFKAAKKQNWDDRESFNFSDTTSSQQKTQQQSQQQNKQLSIAATHVLLPSNNTPNTNSNRNTSIPPDWILQQQQQQKSLLVVTYFLRPNVPWQTMRAIQHVQECRKAFVTSNTTSSSSGSSTSNSSSSIVHYRFVYLPQMTTMIYKILENNGMMQLNTTSSTDTTAATTFTSSTTSTKKPSTRIFSVQSLQLDVFPLDTDLFSLEYPEACAEQMAASPQGSLVTTCMSRSLQKIQDVVVCSSTTSSSGSNTSNSTAARGIPRIQTYGRAAEDVVRKLLSNTVDDYLSSSDSYSSSLSSSLSSAEDPTGSHGPGRVAAMVVMDRQVDMITPMLTPLTYEGLLDQIVGMDCGFLNVNVNKINPPDGDDGDNNATATTENAKKKKQEQQLDKIVSLATLGSDSLYAEVRNQHVEHFGSFLQHQAILLRDSHAHFTKGGGRTKDLQEIHTFVRNIPVFTQNLRSLTNHIHLAEWIKSTTETFVFREQWQLERSMLEGESSSFEVLEDFLLSDQCRNSNSSDSDNSSLNRHHPAIRYLLLLCCQSLCAGGIKSSRYDSFRRDLIQTYGYETLAMLHVLESCGLLRRKEGLWLDATASALGGGNHQLSGGGQAFAALRRSLILIHPEVDTSTATADDISYVSSGYAPLSVRILQTAVKGWKGREDILKELRTMVASTTGGGSGAMGSHNHGNHHHSSHSNNNNSALASSSSATSAFLPSSSSSILHDIDQEYPPVDWNTAVKRSQATFHGVRSISLGAAAGPLPTTGSSATATVATPATTMTEAGNNNLHKPVLLVVYMGGVTWMEVAALRFLSARPSFPFYIVCVTTKVINGSDLIQSLCDAAHGGIQ